MQLSLQQKQRFVDEGYLLLPNAIAPDMVNRVVQTINHRLGQGFPSENLATWQSQTFFPDLASDPIVTDLFNASGLRETLETLLGEDATVPSGRGQLALRFPRPWGTELKPPHPHIDGVHTPTNGVPKGTLGSFTALVGVFLTDVSTQFAGNFAVWPGSHRLMEAYFQQHGLDELLNEGRTPKLDYGEGVQIEARAGDALIAHYQLLHGVTMNCAPMPRYASFFRVTHPQHHVNRLECLTNLWLEWPGIRSSTNESVQPNSASYKGLQGR